MRRWILRAGGLLALLIAAVGGVSLRRGTLRPADGSCVGYRVDETLIGIGLNSGVGLDLVGSLPIEFADYGMEPPSVAGVRDHGRMEVRLRLR